MNLHFRQAGQVLEAQLECDHPPGRLASGKVGWYQVEVVDWRLSWKIRCEVSITAVAPSYGYAKQESIDPHSGHGRHAVLHRDANNLRLSFCLPDCLAALSGFSTFGCSESWTISLPWGWFHCQARLRTQSASSRDIMRWTHGSLEFRQLELGRETVLVSIPKRIEEPRTVAQALSPLQWW
jgi:hypothetical protein